MRYAERYHFLLLSSYKYYRNWNLAKLPQLNVKIVHTKSFGRLIPTSWHWPVRYHRIEQTRSQLRGIIERECSDASNISIRTSAFHSSTDWVQHPIQCWALSLNSLASFGCIGSIGKCKCKPISREPSINSKHPQPSPIW